MARDGKPEDEIWPAIGERYKSTMAVVERQVFLLSPFYTSLILEIAILC